MQSRVRMYFISMCFYLFFKRSHVQENVVVQVEILPAGVPDILRGDRVQYFFVACQFVEVLSVFQGSAQIFFPLCRGVVVYGFASGNYK